MRIIIIIIIIILVILLKIVIMIIITTAIAYYNKQLIRTFPAPNTSTSLQTTLATDAHLAEGQFLLEEQTLDNAKSPIYRAGTRRPTISKTEGQNLIPQ
jgi:hypothetical protein